MNTFLNVLFLKDEMHKVCKHCNTNGSGKNVLIGLPVSLPHKNTSELRVLSNAIISLVCVSLPPFRHSLGSNCEMHFLIKIRMISSCQLFASGEETALTHSLECLF